MRNILYSTFVDFYCLPIKELIALLVTLTYLFLQGDAQFSGRKLWKAGVFLAFAAWVMLISYATVTSRDGGASELMLIPFHSYREVLAGGNPEIYRSNFMNALLFYPAGLLGISLLPKKWHPAWRVLLVTVIFTGFSAGIEYMQYVYSLGRVEIDDVIHNGAGALIGALVACSHEQGL